MAAFPWPAPYEVVSLRSALCRIAMDRGALRPWSAGERVQYWSATFQCWVTAIVVGHNADGTVKLDGKRHADPHLIRALSSQRGQIAASSDDSEQPAQRGRPGRHQCAESSPASADTGVQDQIVDGTHATPDTPPPRSASAPPDALRGEAMETCPEETASLAGDALPVGFSTPERWHSPERCAWPETPPGTWVGHSGPQVVWSEQTRRRKAGYYALPPTGRGPEPGTGNTDRNARRAAKRKRARGET